MERLTRRINGVLVYVGAKNPYSTGQIPCEVEPAGVREMMDRLAAYEETWLTPEEVTALGKLFDYALEESKTLTEQFALLNRIRNLAEADKDGRLVVLPCKMGQRVFALLDTDKHISECEVKQIGMGNKIGFIGLEPIGARGREYGVSINGFGKTVFLTREEAEKALEAMKDGY
jgi:hypothetical protein